MLYVIPLPVVAAQMLHRRANALRRNAAHHRGRQHAGNKRPLRLVFKISAAAWIAVDIDTGHQQQGAAILLNLLCAGPAGLTGKLRIPSSFPQLMQRKARILSGFHSECGLSVYLGIR